jgi:hypothetical protein
MKTVGMPISAFAVMDIGPDATDFFLTVGTDRPVVV